MLKISLELNVLFEDPFWIGMFYLRDGKKCYVERVVFSKEPSDGEIYLYLVNNYNKLLFLAEYAVSFKEKPKNPKRLQRMIKNKTANLETGTKSMQALKLQWEQNKALNKEIHREKQALRKEYLFKLKQEKRKAKHRGR